MTKLVGDRWEILLTWQHKKQSEQHEPGTSSGLGRICTLAVVDPELWIRLEKHTILTQLYEKPHLWRLVVLY